MKDLSDFFFLVWCAELSERYWFTQSENKPHQCIPHSPSKTDPQKSFTVLQYLKSRIYIYIYRSLKFSKYFQRKINYRNTHDKAYLNFHDDVILILIIINYVDFCSSLLMCQHSKL